MLKPKLLILMTFWCFSSLATTFVPTSISERINYSDGLISGVFLGSSVKKLPNGQVATELSFKIEKTAGISPSSIVNKNNFKILIPGGSWNGYVHKVSGTPTFERGEQAVLMITEGPYGHILPDLAFSKFSYKTIDGQKYLVSSIFSEKLGVGKMSLSDFQSLSKDHFGTELVSLNVDKFIDKFHGKVVVKKGRRANPRAPASEKKEDSENNLPFLWSIIALGALGFFSTSLYRSSKEK